MFAVVKTGGKQYRVVKDDVLAVEKLPAEPGETVEFTEVLMLGGETVTLGAPRVEGAKVTAEVVEQFRGPKVISFKKRRRTHSSQRKRGHRQYLTRVRVTEIVAGAQGGAGTAAARDDAATPASGE